MATEADPRSATTATRPAAPAAVRWGAWAGIIYVLAWLIGLFPAPSAPDPFGSAGTINAYFSAHRSAAMIQSAHSSSPDKVLEEMTDWCSRPLDEIRAAVFA